MSTPTLTPDEAAALLRDLAEAAAPARSARQTWQVGSRLGVAVPEFGGDW